MKKALSLFIAVVLMLGAFSLSVFADRIGGENSTPENDFPDASGNSASSDVTITVGGATQHKYAVDVTFTSPVFTYSTGMVWDPATHTYVPSAGATWTGTGSVVITNHSDLPINYEVKGEVTDTSFGTLSIVVPEGEKNGSIEKVNAGDAMDAKQASASWTVEGTPTVAEVTEQKLGTITVAISKVAP